METDRHRFTNQIQDFPTWLPRANMRMLLAYMKKPLIITTVIVYGEFENLLEVDSKKVILYNIYDGTR